MKKQKKRLKPRAWPTLTLPSGRTREITIVEATGKLLAAGPCVHCKRRGMFEVRKLEVFCKRCGEQTGTLTESLKPLGHPDFAWLADFVLGWRAFDEQGQRVPLKRGVVMTRAVRAAQTAERMLPVKSREKPAKPAKRTA